MREKKLDPTYSLKPLCNVLKAYKTFFQVLQKDLQNMALNVLSQRALLKRVYSAT